VRKKRRYEFFISSMKAKDQPKMNILSLFTHLHSFQNFEFLSSMDEIIPEINDRISFFG